MTDVKPALRLSHSQIDMFKQCPLRWKLRYIDKIYGEATPAMVTGTFVHSVFEALYGLDSKERTIENAKIIARTEWDKLVETDDFKAFNLDEATQKQFRINSWKLIRRLWELENPEHIDVVDIEMKLEWKIAEGIGMVGYIDRLSQDRAGLVIADYKSGAKPPKRYESSKVGQILLYALGISKMLDQPISKGVFLFLGGDNPGLVSRYVTQKLIDDTEKQLDNNAKNIAEAKELALKGDLTKVKPKTGPLCGWCDFIAICPNGQEYVQKRIDKGDMRMDAPAVLYLNSLTD